MPIPFSETRSDSDISVLLERVKRHDEAAARALIERIQPVVAKIVNSHLSRRDDPEDLHQEIYMKVFSKLGQYQDLAAFEHWVARIARNTCFDKLRRQQVRPEWRWSSLSEIEQRLFENNLKTDEQINEQSAEAARALVNRVLATLPPRDAWLIRQVDLEEASFEEICQSMNWNIGAGRVRLFRARRKLKKAILKLETDSDL